MAMWDCSIMSDFVGGHFQSSRPQTSLQTAPQKGIQWKWRENLKEQIFAPNCTIPTDQRYGMFLCMRCIHSNHHSPVELTRMLVIIHKIVCLLTPQNGLCPQMLVFRYGFQRGHQLICRLERDVRLLSVHCSSWSGWSIWLVRIVLTKSFSFLMLPGWADSSLHQTQKFNHETKDCQSDRPYCTHQW